MQQLNILKHDLEDVLIRESIVCVNENHHQI